MRGVCLQESRRKFSGGYLGARRVPRVPFKILGYIRKMAL